MTTQSTIASPVGPVPANNICSSCGEPLKLITIKLDNGREYKNLPCWGSCGCGKARREEKGMGDLASRRIKSDLYQRAGVGTEYQRATGDCSDCLQALRDGRNVFIIGPNGTGKTMLAALIAMRLIDHGRKVLFVNAAHAEAEILDGLDGERSDLRSKMCSAPFLVIDDLGKGNPTDWSVGLWYEVSEGRNAKRLPTIVTSNYDGGDLIKRLTVNCNSSNAKAIVSRLRGGAFTVRMDGNDKRLAR